MADETGGALMLELEQEGAASIFVINSTFSENQAALGGGTYISPYSTEKEVQFVQCHFLQNNASQYGAAVFLDGRGEVRLVGLLVSLVD